MDHMEHDHGAVGLHGDGGDHGADGANECMFHHSLVFHVNVCQEILFPGWRTHNGLEIFGSAVVLFLAGFLYEGLKYLREALHKRAQAVIKESQVNINKNECGNVNCGQTNVVKYTMLSPAHGLQTVLHFIQTTCSYVLMLIFMTFQVYLCLGLVLGMSLGYFVFGWRKVNVVDPEEHCH